MNTNTIHYYLTPQHSGDVVVRTVAGRPSSCQRRAAAMKSLLVLTCCLLASTAMSLLQ